MNTKNETSTTQLSRLVGNFDYICRRDRKLPSFNEELKAFKDKAMSLAKVPGTDLAVLETSQYMRTTTLIHLLIVTNDYDRNNSEIRELLAMDSKLIHALDSSGFTPLQHLVNLYRNDSNHAMYRDDFKKTAMLLARQPDVNLGLPAEGQCGNATTLLHILIEENYAGQHEKEINELLQSNPALIGITNACDESLFHAACKAGDLNRAQSCVNLGLQVTDKTKEGRTGLHCAAAYYHHNADLWQWLCDQGIDVNARDNKGHTALVLSINTHRYQKNQNAIRWLIARTDLSVQNDKRETAFQIAQKTDFFCKKTLLLLFKTEHKFQIPTALYSSMQNMHKYGETLKNQGSDKGGVATQLAAKLINLSKKFFTNQDDFDINGFKKEFHTLLHSCDDKMKDYRISWRTIIKNILIACTGIGLFVIIGHLIYTQCTIGRPLFLFQQPKTTSETCIDEIGSHIDALPSALCVW